MDPFTIAAAISLIGYLTLIYVAFLVVSTIINWFRTKARNSKYRATIQEKMRNGQYKTIAVGLDKNYNVEASIGYKSDDIDSDLYNAHYGEEVVIWT
ncbi:MAG: hypothetical protein QNJ68_19110 [Microcoleaceae cyanobacterium MO_207.B10]|nr:hypothetical protein [Microcoleaceae cyanobacterium MO_207.B10]